ncbi:MAG: hypothetical protein J2P40_05265 [Candidatus Dormibacteraeota bacterium]|nr:hypothetical protein [Candidatus Dormibacteraeota bacterium]MBO0760667.1 hypothetical protein [Candidatus Dormibacteraeota bacterium]
MAGPEPEYRPEPHSRPEPEYRPGAEPAARSEEPEHRPEPGYRSEPGARFFGSGERPEPEYRPEPRSRREAEPAESEPRREPEPEYRPAPAYQTPASGPTGRWQEDAQEAESLETLSLSDPKQPSDRRLLQYLLETNRRLTEDAEMRLKREGDPETQGGYPPPRPSAEAPPAGPGDAGADGPQAAAQQDLPVVQRPREYLVERDPQDRPAPDDESMRQRSQKEQDTTDLLERHRRLNEDSRRLLRDS